MMKRMSGLFIAAAALLPGATGDWKTDIEYARPGGEPQTLDAWVPEGKGPFPAVIVVHGGGWVNGHKGMFVTPVFDPLKQAGFTWFTINYRLAPKHRFPAATDDTFAAIEWVKAHAKEYKVDPKRIALLGESAGGHIVAYCGAVGKGKRSVRAVVDFYGGNDMLALAKARNVHKNLQDFLGIGPELTPEAEAKLRAASGQTHIHRGMPPFLFIHGTEDKAVPYQQSPAMCDAMKKAGARCEVYTVDGAPHGVGPWEKNPAWQGYKNKMIEWLKAELK